MGSDEGAGGSRVLAAGSQENLWTALQGPEQKAILRTGRAGSEEQGCSSQWAELKGRQGTWRTGRHHRMPRGEWV